MWGLDAPGAARLCGGALGGATVGAAYAVGTGLALHAHREWEMGAIPMILAGFVFVGLAGGIVASLAAPRHPWLAAFLSMVLLLVFASFFEDLKDVLVPGLDRDARRELWANVDGLLYAPVSFGVPSALLGALLATGPGPSRGLRTLHDLSVGPAGFVVFFAALPTALHLLPPLAALAAAGLLAAMLVVLLPRRHRSARPSPAPV